MSERTASPAAGEARWPKGRDGSEGRVFRDEEHGGVQGGLLPCSPQASDRSKCSLYEELTSFAALHVAFRRARRSARGAPEEASFYFEQDTELVRLSEELRSHTYEPRPYRYFDIRTPKPRTISVAAFRDRVVHHALVGALEPIFEAVFVRHSYACRKRKGTHRAIAWARHYARRFPYFLKLDVRRFFESVSHSILLSELAGHVPDRDVLRLCAVILANACPPGEPTDRPPAGWAPPVRSPPDPTPPDRAPPVWPPPDRRGIPIGNLTSQFWGNVYLHPLDEHLVTTRPGRIHLRYLDDLVLFGHTRAELAAAHDAVEVLLQNRLRLELKPAATLLAPVSEGIPFLGFRVFPGTIRLDRSSKRRYVRKTLGVLRALDAGRIDDEAAAASLSALTGFVETADTHRFRQNLLRRLDEREPESAATRRVRAGGAAVRLADRSTYAGGTGGRAPAQTSGNPEPDAPEPQARRRRVLGEGRASCCGS